MLLKFLGEDAREHQTKVLVMAGLSGITNAGVIAIINAANDDGKANASQFVLFVACCLAYAYSFRYCVATVTKIIEAALFRVRLRAAEHIRDAELSGLERIGMGEIYGQLTQESAVISGAALALAAGLQTTVMLIFMAFYLAAVSPGAFRVVLFLGAIGIYLHQAHNAQAMQHMMKAGTAQGELFEVIKDLLDGFKEVRFRERRGASLVARLRKVAAEIQTMAVRTNLYFQESFVFTNLALYALMGFVVFVLPQFVQQSADALRDVTSGLMFVFGSIGGLLMSLPQYGRASQAAQNLETLLKTLEGIGRVKAGNRVDPWKGVFQEVRAEGLSFAYDQRPGREGFSVGPIDLTIRAGEIIFIVGGNGSGKSTLVKALTGLYAPTSGTLWVNGEPVEPRNVQAYREMIAGIFTDFHLFKSLHGVDVPDPNEVQRLLREMDIAHKVQYKNGQFNTLDLSTGQKKRLAMVVALLEDRPIYVLDEWAADQDPEFRKHYYEELLPSLKRRGKTILAISHDDRYFRCADRVVKMEYGKIRAIEQGRPAEASAELQ